jgi:hypothetical protein
MVRGEGAGHVPLVQRLQRVVARLAAARDELLGLLDWTPVTSGQLAEQADHLQRRQRGLRALVAGLGAGALDGLLDAVHGEHAEGDGNVVARLTWAMPLVHSPATCSKCGVPPRITAPRAMIAS